jgi:hypothetical protein
MQPHGCPESTRRAERRPGSPSRFAAVRCTEERLFVAGTIAQRCAALRLTTQTLTKRRGYHEIQSGVGMNSHARWACFRAND